MSLNINHLKRQFSVNQSSNEDTKKFSKVFHDESKLTITCIENLSNEVLYEIFEYLDGCDIYNAFSNLNSRLQHLITCLSLPFKIKLHSKVKAELEYYCKNFVIPNRHNILSLHFENASIINDFFIPNILDSSFNRLESIALNNISCFNLITLLGSLKSLPRLLFLTVHAHTIWSCYVIYIYQLIFSLSYLKYSKQSFVSAFTRKELHISIPFPNKEQFSTIEYLTIDHNCTFNELYSILQHTPRLHHLNCGNLISSNTSTDFEKLSTLPKLTYLCIDKCRVPFEEFETFIPKISSQLKVLNIKYCKGDSYCDANRWERLIKNHMPWLHRFDYECTKWVWYEVGYDPFSSKINAFISSFWIERQWSFEVKIVPHHMIYSIHPYKKTWLDLEKYDETSVPLNQFSDHISTKHLIRSNQKDIDQPPMQFIIPTLLSIDLIPFTDHLKPLYDAVHFTRLNINVKEISIEALLEIIRELPNLDSLQLFSLSSIEHRPCLASLNNKITKINLQTITDIEQVHSIFHICRHIKYLQVDIPRNMDLKMFVRLILTKAITYLLCPTSLCIYIPNAKEEMFLKLQNEIDTKELSSNCTIKFLSNKIFFGIHLFVSDLLRFYRGL